MDSIRNPEDYQKAIEMLSTLLATDPDPNSDEGRALHKLASLIEAYEAGYIAGTERVS